MFRVEKILFDLDGTLVDTAPDLHAATNHVLTHVGRSKISLDTVRHLVGQGAKKLMELGLEATGGVDDHDIDKLLPVFLDYYQENIAGGSVFYPNVVETLSSLRERGFQIAICTNKPVELAKQLMTALNVTEYFDTIIGGDSFPYRKPDPRHIHDTIAELEGDGPALMIGDSNFDIGAAIAAKIPSIAVSYGYSDIAASELGADITIEDFADINTLVERV
jgi:phosphoglycolate phosphatase